MWFYQLRTLHNQKLPPADQNVLFNEFCLEEHVPYDHMLRKIDVLLDLERCGQIRTRSRRGSGGKIEKKSRPQTTTALLFKIYTGSLEVEVGIVGPTIV
jgi:hypothetical protein